MKRIVSSTGKRKGKEEKRKRRENSKTERKACSKKDDTESIIDDTVPIIKVKDFRNNNKGKSYENDD
jgi:hypothetical protein